VSNEIIRREMDSNYLVIDDYTLDPIEWEVERALKYLMPCEEYDIIPSPSNPKRINGVGKRGIGARR
jgi:hypothetical protein